MRKKGTWGDGVMISAATLVYGREVIVLSAETQRPIQDFGIPKSSNIQILDDADRKPSIFLGMMAFGPTRLLNKTNTSKTLNHFVSLVPVALSQSANNVPSKVTDRSSDSVFFSAISTSTASPPSQSFSTTGIDVVRYATSVLADTSESSSSEQDPVTHTNCDAEAVFNANSEDESAHTFNTKLESAVKKRKLASTSYDKYTWIKRLCV